MEEMITHLNNQHTDILEDFNFLNFKSVYKTKYYIII